MKHYAIALTLLLTLSATKCVKQAASLADKKWVFQSVAGEAVKMPEGVELPWLQLAGEQVQGFGGCNRLMGGYTMEGTKLSFPSLASTKMYCESTMATEDAVKKALGLVDSFKLDKDVLKLMGGGKEVATLKAAAE